MHMVLTCTCPPIYHPWDVDLPTFLLGCVPGLSQTLEQPGFLEYMLLSPFLIHSFPCFVFLKDCFTSPLDSLEIIFCEERWRIWKTWAISRIHFSLLHKAIPLSSLSPKLQRHCMWGINFHRRQTKWIPYVSCQWGWQDLRPMHFRAHCKFDLS